MLAKVLRAKAIAVFCFASRAKSGDLPCGFSERQPVSGRNFNNSGPLINAGIRLLFSFKPWQFAHPTEAKRAFPLVASAASNLKTSGWPGAGAGAGATFTTVFVPSAVFSSSAQIPDKGCLGKLLLSISTVKEYSPPPSKIPTSTLCSPL